MHGLRSLPLETDRSRRCSDGVAHPNLRRARVTMCSRPGIDVPVHALLESLEGLARVGGSRRFESAAQVSTHRLGPHIGPRRMRIAAPRLFLEEIGRRAETE